jgi:hypothetical protein
MVVLVGVTETDAAGLTVTLAIAVLLHTPLLPVIV